MSFPLRWLLREYIQIIFPGLDFWFDNNGLKRLELLLYSVGGVLFFGNIVKDVLFKHFNLF
ncbi:MAG: hypothetical protein MRECE_41c010 [Mycoplasmataceae bacterium CE_OT135]|nr:MAG: hypothetical protein MRECE_41c010 [Mycoplasmataceae bacterium CE_OT135]